MLFNRDKNKYYEKEKEEKKYTDEVESVYNQLVSSVFFYNFFNHFKPIKKRRKQWKIQHQK